MTVEYHLRLFHGFCDGGGGLDLTQLGNVYCKIMISNRYHVGT